MEVFVIVLFFNVILLILFSFSWYRYKIIIFYYKYFMFELWRLVKCMVGVIWGVSIFFIFFFVFGWGEFYFSFSIFMCLLNWLKYMFYSILIFVLLFCIFLCFMIVFYYKIMKFVCKYNKNFCFSKVWCGVIDS